jgi:prepilin-type N-terminal cleavage/methylation domain-containing protein
MPRRPGYTLIEVLIVVVMLGIAGVLVIPSLGSTHVLRVQSTVRTIVSEINFAQSDALARQQGRAVLFEVPENRYSILEVRGATLNPQTDTIQSTNLNNARAFHDSRLVSASFDGSNALVFDELGGPVAGPGSSTPGSGGAIVVTGSGSTFTITVEAYTGRITVARTGP